MSRSHKKTIIAKQQNSKGMKRVANKKIRQKNRQDIIQGKETVGKNKKYKKEFCSYDICDYKFCENVGISKKELKEKIKDKDFRKWYYNK